jgi:hypothetical protein
MLLLRNLGFDQSVVFVGRLVVDTVSRAGHAVHLLVTVSEIL